MTFSYVLTYIASGFGVGLLVGMTGVGGGSLMTPILTLLLGVSPAVAVGTDLAFASVTKSAGTFTHRLRGTVDWGIVGKLCLGALPAALMYRYDEFDHAFVRRTRRAVRDQVTAPPRGRACRRCVPAAAPDERRLSAAPRLHAAHRHALWHAERRKQMRMLAHIARKYDRGYGHFTTRQNIQFNWPKLEDTPDILADLASSRCTPSRPRATASATSPPTISPAPPPTRSPIRARMPKSCASGHRFTRNSPSCRASSRSPSRRRARPRRHPGARHRPAPEEERQAGEIGFRLWSAAASAARR
jgi:hypothetical protein